MPLSDNIIIHILKFCSNSEICKALSIRTKSKRLYYLLCSKSNTLNERKINVKNPFILIPNLNPNNFIFVNFSHKSQINYVSKCFDAKFKFGEIPDNEMHAIVDKSDLNVLKYIPQPKTLIFLNNKIQYNNKYSSNMLEHLCITVDSSIHHFKETIPNLKKLIIYSTHWWHSEIIIDKTNMPKLERIIVLAHRRTGKLIIKPQNNIIKIPIYESDNNIPKYGDDYDHAIIRELCPQIAYDVKRYTQVPELSKYKYIYNRVSYEIRPIRRHDKCRILYTTYDSDESGSYASFGLPNCTEMYINTYNYRDYNITFNFANCPKLELVDIINKGHKIFNPKKIEEIHSDDIYYHRDYDLKRFIKACCDTY